MSHASVAKAVRLHKDRHPELYCAVRVCLWRISDGVQCPKHSSPPVGMQIDFGPVDLGPSDSSALADVDAAPAARR